MPLPPRAKLVIALTLAGAGVVGVLGSLDALHTDIGRVAVVAAVTAFMAGSWIWPIVMFRGSQSSAIHLDEGLFVMLVLALPAPGVLLVFAAGVAIAQVARRRPPVKSVFNLGQTLVSVGLGLLVSHALAPVYAHQVGVRELAATLAGAVVYMCANALIVGAIIAATTGGRVLATALDGVGARSLLAAASVVLGLVGGLVLSARPTLGLIALLPFVVFRQVLQGHFVARHDRARLMGLLDATVGVHAAMRGAGVEGAIEEAAAELLRCTGASLTDEPPLAGTLGTAIGGGPGRGWLVVSGRARSEPFEAGDRTLLDALGAVGSVALENATLYRETLAGRERLLALTSSLGEGVCAFDGASHLTFVNPAARDMLGIDQDDALDGTGGGAAGLSALQGLAKLVMASGETVRSERDTLFRADGTAVPVAYTCSPIRSGGEPAGVVVTFRDMSERVAFEEQLSHHAFHDALTGLANRRLFLHQLQHCLERSERRPGVSAVLFADVDRFKLTNDSLGHSAGDQILVAIAGRLRQLMRPEDTLARFGGDEFTVLLEEIPDAGAAEAVARRMLAIMEEPIVLDDNRSVVTTLSIGIALASAGSAADDLLHNADVAMYESKHSGPGHYEVFDPLHMGARSASWIDLEAELRQAPEQDEMQVHYQPLVDTATGRVVGTEALVRWEHPRRGLLGPSEFIGIAEETGLILPLGLEVLAKACRQAARWREALRSPVTVSVNLSPRQFQSPGLVADVGEALSASGLDAEALCLEITEGLAVDNVERTISILSGLKRLGVRLAIDDFGTGYSSLAYLKRFPVDVVKLDRSFVTDIDVSEADAAIAGAVVQLAGAMGMTAVAEGVETEAQLRCLLEAGCPVVQGYLLGRPVPAGEMTRLLAEQERAPEAGLELLASGA